MGIKEMEFSAGLQFLELLQQFAADMLCVRRTSAVAANKHLAPRAKRKEKHVKSFSDGIPALFKTWVSRIELIK